MVQERNVHSTEDRLPRPGKPIRASPVVRPAVAVSGLVAGGALILLLLFAARSAVDLVIVLVAAAAIVVLQRTVGDWLADSLGPGGSALLFAVAAIAAGWLLVGTDDGRARVLAGMSWAEEHGFHGALITPGAGVTVRTGGGSYAAAPPAAPRVIAPGRNPVVTDTPIIGRTTTTPVDRAVGSTGEETAGDPVSSSVTLRIVAASDGALILEATVTSQGTPVSGGRVEFLVDAQVAGTAAVGGGGRARSAVLSVAPGSHRATARFTGTRQVPESTSAAVPIPSR